MARTGSFSALLCENSGRRAKFPGKLPRSILKAAIPVERAQVLMASYRSVPCVSPTTIMRWVQRYVPEFVKRWQPYARAVGTSWRIDETYIKVMGKWVYLYRG